MSGIIRKIGKVITHKITIMVLVVLAIIALVWFGGPLISIGGYEILASVSARISLLLIIACIWLAVKFWKLQQASSKNKKLIEHISKEEQDQLEIEQSSDDEIAVLEQRMSDALQYLKKSDFKGKNLYQLPWYVLIGPPGAGKTTSIVNSGVNLPLADEFGTSPIKGVGGTRNCDWWFTDDAVLLDTAGRYTTQDSYREVDSRAWLGFLELLKKSRPMRPVNGAIVTISIADLLQQTQSEINELAGTIRKRIQELKMQLGVNIPVYLMLSKGDLLAGFNELFDDISRDEREEVFGFTFEVDEDFSHHHAVAKFNKYFVELIQSIERKLSKKLQSEKSEQRRALIYSFPRQLRLAQKNIDDFIQVAFSQNRYEEPILLRGVYITSATQEGTPINRIGREISNSFGFQRERSAASQLEGKGYFIKRLLKDVIFKEDKLVGVNISYQKRQRLIHRVGYAVSGFCLVTLSYLWSHSYANNKQIIDSTSSLVSEYTEASNGGINEQSNLIELNGGLNVLKKFSSQILANKNALSEGFGLYQGDKFGGITREVYSKGLVNYYGPYLKGTLEKEMLQAKNHHDYLYELLRIYLMFYLPQHKEDKDITSLFEHLWRRDFPGEINEELRTDLKSHLSYFLDQKMALPQQDGKLIDYAQNKLSKVSLVERVYNSLLDNYLTAMPEFKPSDYLSQKVEGYFYRKSGKSLREGIPGLYTQAGYHGVFKRESKKISEILSKDSWVLPSDETESLDKLSILDIQEQVRDKYFSDYIFYWKELISDVAVREFSTPEEGALMLQELTGVNAPIERLYSAIRDNVMLARPKDEGVDLDAAKDVVDTAASSRVNNNINRYERLIPDSADIDAAPEQVVNDAFAEIIHYVGDPGSASALKQSLGALKNMQIFLESISNANNAEEKTYEVTSSPQAASIISELEKEASVTPQPMSEWLGKVENSGKTLTNTGTYSYLNNLWKTQVLTECRRAIEGRYPVNKRSRQDITLDDFRSFFAYGGTIDRFFDQHLSVFVDTSRGRWRLLKDIGISNYTLRQLEKAKSIRESFFVRNGSDISVNFTLKPSSLSVNAGQVLMDIEGQILSYRHGPLRSYPTRWPGPKPQVATSISFTPTDGGQTETVRTTGFWSLFRLLDKAKLKKTLAYDKFLVEFKQVPFDATFELQAHSVNNPFFGSDLEGFNCPTDL